jgi:hypothetical protein
VDDQAKADRLTKDLEQGVKDAFKYCAVSLESLYSVPREEAEAGQALKQYLPFTHWTGHKNLGKVPTDMNMASCRGDIAMTTVTTTMSNCALACNTFGTAASGGEGRCSAFQFYEAPDVAQVTTYRWCAMMISWGSITTMEQLEKCEHEESSFWCPQVHPFWCDKLPAAFKGGATSEAGLCTLFTEVNQVNLYTAEGCREHDGPASFLQKKGEKHNIRCVAKFSEGKDLEHRFNSKKGDVKQIDVNELNRCLS